MFIGTMGIGGCSLTGGASCTVGESSGSGNETGSDKSWLGLTCKSGQSCVDSPRSAFAKEMLLVSNSGFWSNGALIVKEACDSI